MPDIEKLLSLMGDMFKFDKGDFDKLNTLANRATQIPAEEDELNEDELEQVAAAQKSPSFGNRKPTQ